MIFTSDVTLFYVTSAVTDVRTMFRKYLNTFHHFSIRSRENNYLYAQTLHISIFLAYQILRLIYCFIGIIRPNYYYTFKDSSKT